jgi:hypothetical protein
MKHFVRRKEAYLRRACIRDEPIISAMLLNESML